MAALIQNRIEHVPFCDDHRGTGRKPAPDNPCPETWNNGSESSQLSSCVNGISPSTPSALERCAATLCAAAFGKPLDPEVSVSVAMRSGCQSYTFSEKA